jgi:hypothetical protein
LQQKLKKTDLLALIPLNLVMTDNENLSLFNIVKNSLPLSVPKKNYLIKQIHDIFCKEFLYFNQFNYQMVTIIFSLWIVFVYSIYSIGAEFSTPIKFTL